MADGRLALLGGPKAITRTEELGRVARWPIFGEEEQRRVGEVLAAADVYAENGRFEEEFRTYTGSRFAVAQNNGTSTLHAAYLHTHWAGHPALAQRFAAAVHGSSA